MAHPDEVVIALDITQDDIDIGVPGMCSECPVARALFRAFPGATGVWVGAMSFRVDFEKETIVGSTPESLRLFTTLFDRYKGRQMVKPGRHEVRIPRRRVPRP